MISVADILKKIRGVSNAEYNVVGRYTEAVAIADATPAMSKNELVTRLVSTCIGLAASFTITYFGFKYLANVLDPTRDEKKVAQKRAEELMKRIGVSNAKLTEYELCIASNLVDPLSMTVSWEDIGGLEEVVEELQETVILPFRRHELFVGSSLLQAPKGVLLHGPPGCGKTMIAKAMAKAAGARFINLQVSSLVDKWYGESQKRAEAVFSLALKLQPTIIFIDEIDAFLRSRTSTDHEATAMIKTQFMSFWDGLLTNNKCRIMIVGATNRPTDVDAAILRRMPSMFHIGYPNCLQRRHILGIILSKENVTEDIDLDKLASETQGSSGSDLRELCRNAAVYRVRDFVREELKQEVQSNEEEKFSDCSSDPVTLRPLCMKDLENALSKMKQSKANSLFGSPVQIDLD